MSSPIVLVSMPWRQLTSPSMQLGLLKPLLERDDHRVECCSFFLSFVKFLLDCPELEVLAIEKADLDEVSRRLAVGGWIFAAEPLRPVDPAADHEFFTLIEGDERFVDMVTRIRQVVPRFIDRCADEVLSYDPGVVGFTTLANQCLPSLSLAKRLRQLDPDLKLVFGGSNCDGTMGAALARAYPFIDAVVRGEGELVAPPLFTAYLNGEQPGPAPGLCLRDEHGELTVTDNQSGALASIAESPTPDYDEYFTRLEASPFCSDVLWDVKIPFESARGCWWGAKHHCPFCGLNGSSMEFRSKPAERVYADILALAERHQHLTFLSVDTIIDTSYFRELMPRFEAAGLGLRIFYEAKANMSREQLASLRAGGVTELQPGIETLSTRLLRLIDKGMTATQGVRLLKWCNELGIDVIWNILYGIPGERVTDYDAIIDAIPRLSHFIPPTPVALQLHRFSPYHSRPADYGLVLKGPQPFYRLLYGIPEDELNDFAYYFDFAYTDGTRPQKYAARLRQAVADWTVDYRKGASLHLREGPGFIAIEDQRSRFLGGGSVIHRLDPVEAEIYLACDAGGTARSIANTLHTDEARNVSEATVADFLEQLDRLGLVFRDEERFVSLATRPRIPGGTPPGQVLSRKAARKAESEPNSITLG